MKRLTQDSPIWELLETLQNAIYDLSDNETVYDDDLNKCVDHDTLDVIINELKEEDHET